MNDVEILTVHYKTPDLIYSQYESIRKFYPEIKYRIIDGSDNGISYFEDIEREDSNFSIKRFGYNIHHGPGMDYGIKTSNFNYLLIIDSDITIKKPLIFDMLKSFNGFSVGKKLIMDSTGHEHNQKPNTPKENFIYDYIHPYTMLINKEKYLKFKPFIKHGSPCIQTMIDIHNKKCKQELVDFKIEEYVNLITKGTRSIWGLNI